MSEAICKVMLQVYRELDERCAEVDSKIIGVATHSRNADIFESARKIARLGDEGRAYVEIKEIIEQALEDVRKKEELTRYFINGESITSMCRLYNTKRVNIVDKINRQKSNLFKEILKWHSTEELFEIISCSKWIMSIYNGATKRAVNGQSNKGGYTITKEHKTANRGKSDGETVKK